LTAAVVIRPRAGGNEYGFALPRQALLAKDRSK
jgi:hypothetical protein